MIELMEKAEKYAAGKANEAIDKAIAQAYADGYRDGYKDREEEIPVDIRDNKTEYVDLGLPSGTLWSRDYEKGKEDKLHFTQYDKAQYLNIPTEEQWRELFSTCKSEYIIFNDFNLGYVNFTGPNGNVISFCVTGKIDAYNIVSKDECFFWLKEEIEGNMKKSVHIFNIGKNLYPKQKSGYADVADTFSGHKLPVRLVRTK